MGNVLSTDDESQSLRNVTPAGLGQGIFTPGNFEAGILTDNSELVSSIKALFTKIWDDDICKNCHRADKCNE